MKLLHPTDFSKAADKAGQLAWDLSERVGGSLHVVHVQRSYESLQGFLAPRLDEVSPELQRRLEETRNEEQRTILKRLAHLTPPGASHELRWGEPLSELLDVAPDYDLVVMGAQGVNRLDELFLGSTANRLVRRSSVPVLTIREENEVRPLKRALVGVGFEEPSRAAWAFCERLADHGIGLVAAHVVDNRRFADDVEQVRALDERLEAFAGGRAEHLAIRSGDPVTILIELAEEFGATMLVVGLRRHHGVIGILSRRTDLLLRSSPVPILSVPSLPA